MNTIIFDLVGESGVENLILGYIAGQPNQAASEADILAYLERVSNALITAKMLRMAADGKIRARWSVEDDDFVFVEGSEAAG